ncbi:Alpha-pyrone synthesis polyketide synthase-like Pks11 [Enhygromyxa salina]|uniref:Alpha-pyrone synthesis polyketide synthase-like Pks11 n=1 Tax=Enhygromyxa salina TaxID=215803 RepID=A0A2S9YB33_9BACT|nr:3-oxoacyl-[acyl-carrier-protein] synthase III C-terminal domain-containing protein [Enhygromyxa salina]PRQ02320.1 Alpha-pyrone synthesis polyketide synthase-like Pks11 [Enhygromyxa salina]
MAARTGILAVASASPEHVLTQAQAKQFARGMFTEYFADRGEAGVERLLRAYDNAGVETRQLGRPLDWYERSQSFAEKNAAYVEQALAMSHRAAAAALARAGLDPSEVGAIVFASSTGVSTPSLDARLVQELDLRRDVARVPIWGLGCAGGAGGLARARTLALGLGEPVLLIACELCSLTFMHSDRRRANLIAVALFGDGAAAAVVAPEPWWDPAQPAGPELLGGFSRLIDDSEHIMGWDVEDEGLRVRFSPKIPGIVSELGAGLIADAARDVGLEPGALRHLLMHPGGRKVIDAYERALGLEPGRLRHARGVLRDHGNMSSPTVLFVLERFLAEEQGPRGEAGLLLGLGPGFCAEGVVLRW